MINQTLHTDTYGLDRSTEGPGTSIDRLGTMD